MAPIVVFRSHLRCGSSKILASAARHYATSAARTHHRIVVVGGGSAGVTVAAQLQRAPELSKPDIAIIDPTSTHWYQV